MTDRLRSRPARLFSVLILCSWLEGTIAGSACATPIFSAALSFETGLGSTFAAIGDVNGDGKPDLATANFSANTVSVLLGNGDGTFQANVDYPTAIQPQAVAIGDVSGDGKPDLVTADYGAGKVSVLLGNGDGTFQAKVDYVAGTSLYSIAIGDVSGDGKPDVVTSGLNGVSVLLGNGDGTFQTKMDYGTDGNSNSVAIGDVSGDGKPDLVAANPNASTSGTVSVLLGNGDGTFQAKVDYPTGLNPSSIAIGDLGSGSMSLVTTNAGGNTVSVLPGNGDGTFQTRIDFGTGPTPTSVAIGDMSGDGKPDLVTANYGGSSVSFLGSLVAATTDVTVLTLSTEATPGRVRIEWYARGDRILLATVYRRTADTDWVLQRHPGPATRRILYEDDTVSPGVRYGYRLVVRDVTGYETAIETWVSVPTGRTGAPAMLRLESARPNPFGGQTELSYGLPRGGRVRLDVFDVQGRRVASIVDRDEVAGWRSVVWDGRDMAGREVGSGTYFLRLESDVEVQVRKIVLAR